MRIGKAVFALQRGVDEGQAMQNIFLIGDSIRYGVSHPERHENTGYGIFIMKN